MPAEINGQGRIVWTTGLKVIGAVALLTAGLVGNLLGRLVDARDAEFERRIEAIEVWKEQGGRWTIRQQAEHQRDTDRALYELEKRLAIVEAR